MANPIDFDKVINDLDKTLLELRQGIKPKKLTPEERSNILLEFDKLEIQAYKCKISPEVKSMAESSPGISFKEVLMGVLPILPATLSVAALKELIDFTGEVWGKANALVAA